VDNPLPGICHLRTGFNDATLSLAFFKLTWRHCHSFHFTSLRQELTLPLSFPGLLQQTRDEQSV
jgi:hypothetical protein